jgi:hypothetical protein
VVEGVDYNLDSLCFDIAVNLTVSLGKDALWTPLTSGSPSAYIIFG